jgi:hypothetical protein
MKDAASPSLGPGEGRLFRRVGSQGIGQWRRDGKIAVVRDRLWIWAHEAGSYTGLFGLPTTSSIAPVAAAIFLASCICDLGLETVEWARHWIAEVADQVLPGPTA